MIEWNKIDTFPFPTTAWDYDYPMFLFYDPSIGIRLGRCIKQELGDETRYEFRYDIDEYAINPTHWLPLPNKP